MKIIHLSDLHIGKSNNLEKANLVVDWIIENREDHQSELVIISGDLVDDALYFAGDSRRLLFEDVRNTEGLTTGDEDSYQIEVVTDSEPLKITVVWTDVPGTIGSALASTNNLDLIVTAPDMTTYRGNVFVGTESATGGAADAVTRGPGSSVVGAGPLCRSCKGARRVRTQKAPI